MDIQFTEQMNALFENAPLGIGMTNIEGQILAANETLLAMTDYTEDEFVGRNVVEVYADPEQRTDLLKKLSKADAVKDFGVKIKRRDESQFYASLNVSKLNLNSEEILLVMIEDVSEQVELKEQLQHEILGRQKIEEDLRSQIALVDGLLDTTLDTMVIIDSKTLRYLKWNKSVTQITGYSDEDFSTMNPFEVFFDEEELPRVEAAVEELMREGIVTTSHTHINKDGSKTTLEYTGSVTRDLEGDPQNLIFIGRDITERKQAEEQIQQEVAERKRTEAELQAQINLFDSLLDTAADTIEIFDPDTLEYIKWNKACTELTGYSDEEFARMNPATSFFDEADARRVEAGVSEVLKGKEILVTADLIAKDGRRTPMEFLGSLARDAEGNPKYFIAIGRDITERKQAEEHFIEKLPNEKKQRQSFRLSLCCSIACLSLYRTPL